MWELKAAEGVLLSIGMPSACRCLFASKHGPMNKSQQQGKDAVHMTSKSRAGGLWPSNVSLSQHCGVCDHCFRDSSLASSSATTRSLAAISCVLVGLQYPLVSTMHAKQAKPLREDGRHRSLPEPSIPADDKS